eukprot:scaffold1599_cov115-Cylindrotheca_fusiformis.AAC.6
MSFLANKKPENHMTTSRTGRHRRVEETCGDNGQQIQDVSGDGSVIPCVLPSERAFYWSRSSGLNSCGSLTASAPRILVCVYVLTDSDPNSTVHHTASERLHGYIIEWRWIGDKPRRTCKILFGMSKNINGRWL